MKIPHLRWWIAGLLFFSTVNNYVDCQTLSVLVSVLGRDLGISDIQYANIFTAFLAAYTVMNVGSGLIVDRFGTRASLSLFVVWWSLANMAHAFARGAWSLGAMRFLLGMGESGNFMAAFKAVSEWYPAKERALVHGIIQSGAAIGAILAPPVITWINARYGWQPAFIITGSLGVVWLIFWLLLYHPPEKHPQITDEERPLVLADTPAPAGARGHEHGDKRMRCKGWGRRHCRPASYRTATILTQIKRFFTGLRGALCNSQDINTSPRSLLPCHE